MGSGINIMSQDLIYLASPYSSEDKDIREHRAQLAAQAAAILKQLGFHILAPIPHGHAMVPYGLPGGYEEFWKPYCHNVIKRVDRLVVLMLPGWEESVGVQDEIEIASNRNIPITYVTFDEVFDAR